MSYWEMAYGWGWCTIDQLRLAVRYKEITEGDFERITGEVFAQED